MSEDSANADLKSSGQRLRRRSTANDQEYESLKRQIDRSLHEKRELEALLSHASDIFWRLDTESMAFTYINPAVEQWLDLTPAEACLLGPARLLSAPSGQTLIENLRKLLPITGILQPAGKPPSFDLDLIHNPEP